MKWLVIPLLLTFYKIPDVNSSPYQELSLLNPPLVSPRVNSTEEETVPGRRAQFRMHGVSLTLDESLSRKIEKEALVRVYNGDDAWLGHIPFIVRLYIFKSSYRYLCGGSILAENWVVTAAHCITERAQYQGKNHTFTTHGPHIQVVAGDVSVNVYEVSTVVRWVTQVYTHENYNQWYLQSDIALLYLENGFDLNSPYISKINIADSQPAAGSSVTIAGWGEQENEEIATVLQYVKYGVPDQNFCVQNYRNKGYYILPGMLCTGDSIMKVRSGKGDSGGPVFRSNGQDNYTLFGLVSWGVENNVGLHEYDINTDVAYYKRWIENIMVSHSQYRVKLSATTEIKWITWKSSFETFRYQVYNISSQSDMFVKVVITSFTMSQDYSHVIIRDGDKYDSPILLQQHDNLQENQTLSAISSSNKLLILIRTTGSYSEKLVRFFYFAVSLPAVNPTNLNRCGDIDSSNPDHLEICSNLWECYDPAYKCDGMIADCTDWSDEQFCSSARSLLDFRILLLWIPGMVTWKSVWLPGNPII